eukprot:scaffold3367_cov82-Skeletonema_dohrnii-CCMP3373.AAC.3
MKVAHQASSATRHCCESDLKTFKPKSMKAKGAGLRIILCFTTLLKVRRRGDEDAASFTCPQPNLLNPLAAYLLTRLEIYLSASSSGALFMALDDMFWNVMLYDGQVSVRPSKRIPTYVPPVPTAIYVHGRYVEFWRSGSSKST